MSKTQYRIDVISAEEMAGGRTAYYTETTLKDRIDMRRAEKSRRSQLYAVLKANHLRSITRTKQDARRLIDKVKQLGFTHELEVHELHHLSAFTI